MRQVDIAGSPPTVPASAHELIVVATNYHGEFFDGLASGTMGCYLVREPENAFDRNAVMVVTSGWLRGYLSATRAAQYAPILDRLGGCVSTALRTDGKNAFVLIPKPDALTEWAASL